MITQSGHYTQRGNSTIVYALCGVLVAVILATVVTGCRRKDDSQLLAQARSMFREVLVDFDTQRTRVTSELEEGKSTLLTFREAINSAQDKDAEFRKVHTKWRKVESEVQKLHAEFANLVRGADTLYAELYGRANSITTSDEMKTQSLRSLDESKEKYTDRLKQSKTKIDALDGLYTKVRDTMTALEIDYTLDILESRLTRTFEEIDTMIVSITEELDQLSHESESLLLKRFE
jgi:chromosome segregation ATPase